MTDQTGKSLKSHRALVFSVHNDHSLGTEFLRVYDLHAHVASYDEQPAYIVPLESYNTEMCAVVLSLMTDLPSP